MNKYREKWDKVNEKTWTEVVNEKNEEIIVGKWVENVEGVFGRKAKRPVVDNFKWIRECTDIGTLRNVKARCNKIIYCDKNNIKFDHTADLWYMNRQMRKFKELRKCT